MKIIQSFWSCNRNIVENSYGWLSPKHHLLGWGLSIYQLSKFYDVELYTDTNSAKILIDHLKLPFSKVHIVFDTLEYQKDLWAVPKIITYSAQKEPFLHIDGDVFIFEKFSDDLLKKDLISQNLEVTTDYYGKMWNEIYPHLEFVPKEMTGYVTGKNKLACNMGIFGGNDIEFLNEYSKKSLDFVNQNRNVWKKINQTNFNIFFEQVLFYEMMSLQNKTCDFLISEVSEDNSYKNFGDFNKVPFERTYLHLLGNYKKSVEVCNMMETHILYHYPELYEKVRVLFPDTDKFPASYDFSKKSNEMILNDFYNQADNKNISNDYILISRDLAIVDQYEKLQTWLNEKIDFKVSLMKGFDILHNNENKAIRVINLGNIDNFFEIDGIDQLILNEIQNSKYYSEIKHGILKMVAEDAQEMKDQLMDMVEKRLKYFHKQKVISVTV